MRFPLIDVPESELLAKLPTATAGAKKSFRIQAAAKDEVAELAIYDVIWPWEPKRLLGELNAIKAKTINLRLNSPGGDAFGGVAIYNALVRHSAKVVTHVDGIAASAASIVAMAGDEIRMNIGSMMMIHEPWWLVAGGSADLRGAAAVLDKIAISMAGVYAARTGKSEREVLELMEAETWFSADEAVEEGFADSKTERPAAHASFDLSQFANVPADLAAAAAGAKEQRRPETIRDFEAFLRDEGGFSHAAAKAIAAAGFKGTPEPRDEDGAALLADIEARLAMTRLQLALTH